MVPKQNKLVINLKTNVNLITPQEFQRQEPTLGYTTQNNKDVLIWTDPFLKLFEQEGNYSVKILLQKTSPKIAIIMLIKLVWISYGKYYLVKG